MLSVPQNIWKAFLKVADPSTTPTATSLSLGLLILRSLFMRAGKQWAGLAAAAGPALHPRRFVAGGGRWGDNDHSETTYLSNCLFNNKNYSVALSMNSQREGAAGGSWRLCFKPNEQTGAWGFVERRACFVEGLPHFLGLHLLVRPQPWP